MSKALRNIEKYLKEGHGVGLTSKFDTLVILADSKGKYLKNELPKIHLNIPNIIWWSRSSKRTSDGTHYLERKINNLARDNKKIFVAFWYGTCDVTTKEGDFIFQRYQDDNDLTSELQTCFDKLVQLNSRHENVSIGILEIPPVFTKEWNKAKDYELVDLISDDKIHKQVSETNKLIRKYNETLNYKSPQFSCDFEISHRKKPKPNRVVEPKTRYILSPALLRDGVHPIDVVAQKWLHKIIESILVKPLENTDLEMGPSCSKKART